MARTTSRRRGRLAATGLLVGLLLLALAAAISQTAAFRGWLRDRVLEHVNARLAARLSVGDLEGDLFHTLGLRDVELTLDGERVLAARRVRVRVHPLELLTHRRLRLGAVTVDGLALRLVEDARGWNVARLAAGGGETEGSGVPLPIVVDAVRVTGAAVKIVRPHALWRARDLALAGSAAFGAERQRLTVTALTASLPERGVEVGALSGTLVIGRDGTLAVDRLELRTRESQLSGRAAITGGPDRRHYEVALDVPRLSAAEARRLAGSALPASDLSGALRAQGPAEALVVEAELASAGGTIGVTGRVDLTRVPSAYDLRATLAHLDAAAVLGGACPATDLNGTLTLTGSGTVVAEAALAAKLSLHDSQVAGTPLPALSADATIRARTIELQASASASGGGRAEVGGTLALAEERYELHASATDLDPAPFLGRSGLVSRLSGTAVLKGRGFTPAAAEAEAHLALGPSRLGAIRVRRGRADLRAAAGRLTIERAVLESSVGDGEVSGALALTHGTSSADARPTGTLRYQARVADLGPLATLAGVAPLAGAATVTGTASGSLDALDLHATCKGRALAHAGIGIAVLESEVAASGLGGGGPQVTVRAHAERLRAAGRRFDALDLEGSWRRAQVGLAHAAIDLRLREDAVHRHAVAARVVLRPDETRLEIASLRLGVGEQSWVADGRPLIVRRGDRVTVENLVLRAGRGLLDVEGSAGRRGAQDLRVRLEGLDLGFLESLVGDHVGGRLDATAHLAGTATAPTLEAEIAVAAPTVGATRYQALHATLAAGAGRARVELSVAQQGGRALALEAALPVEFALAPPRFVPGSGLSGTLRATAIDLALLDPLVPQVSRLAGTLDADLALEGSLARPAARGTVAIEHGRAYVVPLGVTYEPFELRARVAGESVDISTLRIVSGRGTLTGSGRAGLDPAETTVDARLELGEFPLFANQYGHGAASGAVWITGSTAAPVVEGRLRATGLVLQIPESMPGVVREPDPTIQVVGPGAPARTEAVPPEPRGAEVPWSAPALYERAAITVQLDVPSDAWIRRTDSNVELRGWMTAWKKPRQELRLAGEIETVRGWYSFQGKKFNVAEGRVTFTGEGFDPLLDLVAVHTVGEYTVRVIVRGTLSKPALTLESEPALEQADVLAVLLFGRPANQLSRAESTGLRERALGVVANYAASELGQSVASALGVDSLEFETGPQGIGDAKVSIGKYLAEDLFVSLAHRFGKQNVDEVRVEYRITPQWSIETSSDTLGDSGIDLFWRRRY